MENGEYDFDGTQEKPVSFVGQGGRIEKIQGHPTRLCNMYVKHILMRRVSMWDVD